MASLRSDIASCIKTWLPYFERDDKDAFLYIANAEQLSLVVENLAQLVEEKFISTNNARDEICPSCGGTGEWSGGGVGGTHICGYCKGTGKLSPVA